MPQTIVIDPGHGGSVAVGGSSPNNAVGPNGLLEKDVTLDLARRVAALLSEHGNVLLTRTGDENRSLVDRARVARDSGAAVFLSIHLNGWRDPGVDGSEAWVAVEATQESSALARAVLDRVVAVTHARDRGVRRQDLGVLVPGRLAPRTAATLLEVAFLTNADEASRFAHDDYKQALAQAIASGVVSRLGGNGAVAQSLGASDQADAVAIIQAFRAETTPGAFTPQRPDVADRAIALINDPTLVDQASLNLCGPAAAHRLWIDRDPKAFARYLTSLYDTGEADFGSKHIKPGSDLRHNDYDGHAVPAMRATSGGVCPPADWIALSSLRDASNTFLDFEGMPDEDVSGITTPGELASWLRALGLYGDVSDEGNWFLTKGIDHAEGLAPDANTDIAMLINAHILSSSAASGHKKSDEFILSAFPNHFVVLRSRVTEPTPDEVEFDCWTWGSNVHVRVPKNVFGANYYGAVIARVPAPAPSTSSLALGDTVTCRPVPLTFTAYARPLWAAGEHVEIADDLYHDQLLVGQSPGVAFSYGELVAMADLYASADLMMDASAAELTQIKQLLGRSTAYYRGGKADRSLKPTDTQWNDATGGRYIELAFDNDDHFTPRNRTAWEDYHRRAIEEARKLAASSPGVSSLPVWPLILNAFGDHFLTDAFSAGHLIDKEAMIAAFKANFFSGGSLTDAGEAFFDRVADAAFTGEVEDKFSVLEDAGYPVCKWGWCLKWHPNIDTTHAFYKLLIQAAEEEPDKVAGFAVMALHDRLNEEGIDVVNAAGESGWHLPGDAHLDARTLGIMRTAVQQSIADINDPAILQPGYSIEQAFADVWRYTPQPTAAEQQRLQGLTREYTDPTSHIFSTAAAGVIHDELDSLISVLIARGKLKPA